MLKSFFTAAISNASSYFGYFDLNPDVDRVSCVLRMCSNKLLLLGFLSAEKKSLENSIDTSGV